MVEGLRLTIMDAKAAELGELFLVHGHQGTLWSERYRDLSIPFLRYIFRPLQRFLRFKWTTPSNNFKLKKEHEQAMYSWADSANGPVLIAGHTHHPVWVGLSYEQALEEQERFEQRTRDETEQRWIEQEIGGRVELPGEKPCYFNTGCCSFSDGSITGIEIEDGEIRLIRWRSSSQPDSAPARKILFAAPLADVFKAVGSSQ